MESRVLADRYELQERIGSGGMGTVWRAHDRSLGRDVAVKLLHEGLAADATFLRRFWGEARAAARLTHPNVVAVYDTGTQDGIPFIVMELVDGESVHSILNRVGPLSVDATAHIGRAVLGAVAHAHDRGLVHRDLKPANVLVEKSSREPKVADFGIAKGLEDTGGITRTGGLIGTAAYLSPEQVSGHPATPASDLYSVGCLLYACLAGEPPFNGATAVAVAMRHLHDRVPPLRDRRPDVPPALEAVVHRALEKDPGRRFASAADMRNAIAAAGIGSRPITLPAPATVPMGGTGPLPHRTGTQHLGRPTPPPSKAGRILAALTAALILAAGVWLVAVYLQGRRPSEVPAPLPTPGPSLAPEALETATPSPTPTAAQGTEETGGPGFPLDLPGFGD